MQEGNKVAQEIIAKAEKAAKIKYYTISYRQTVRVSIEAENEKKALDIFNTVHPGIAPTKIEYTKIKEYQPEYIKEHSKPNPKEN